jgi:hypothetical protein
MVRWANHTSTSSSPRLERNPSEPPLSRFLRTPSHPSLPSQEHSDSGREGGALVPETHQRPRPRRQQSARRWSPSLITCLLLTSHSQGLISKLTTLASTILVLYLAPPPPTTMTPSPTTVYRSRRAELASIAMNYSQVPLSFPSL